MKCQARNDLTNQSDITYFIYYHLRRTGPDVLFKVW